MIGGGAVKFALIFTLGNICSVASTFFMIGPCKQLKLICKKTRKAPKKVMLLQQVTLLTYGALFSLLQIIALKSCQVIEMSEKKSIFVPETNNIIH